MRFYDGLDRRFIPYKGWMKVGKDSSLVRDELTIEGKGPFQIVTDTISHINWHTLDNCHILYNLIDSAGKTILPKGVRQITYYSALGYYLIEDNNEDELINRGDVKGGYLVKDYRERCFVVTEDGTLDDSQETVSSLRILKNRGFCGRFNVDGLVIEDGRWLKNEKCDKNCSDYSAAMWADKGIWGMNEIKNSDYKHYFFGQGNMLINYAHEVLCSNIGSIFLKKEEWWYLRFLGGRMMKCFCEN